MIKDSGKRRSFDSGAVRDIDEGKGRCDLLPLDILSCIYDGDLVLASISEFVRNGNISALEIAIKQFTASVFKDIPTASLELSQHYAEGCAKYGERNWEKGIPLHCYIDSGVRHYLKWCRGDQDERHDRAFLWNMYGCLWTLKNKPELNDLPFRKENNNE